MTPEFIIVGGASPTQEQIARPVENAERFASLQSITRDDLGPWIERLRDARIQVDRHNSPDLIRQLTEAKSRPIDTVLCSLLDSDPTVALNAAVAKQFSQEVVAGAMLVARIVAQHTLLCADQRLPLGGWDALRKLIRGSWARLAMIANDYPQADPTLLVYSLVGRRLLPGQSPTERSTIILDAAAAMAVGRKLLADEPMNHVPIAARDHAKKHSHYVMAPVGMKIGELLTALGQPESNALIRGGDLLRDLMLSRDTSLGAGELVIHTSDPEPDINPDACIRCAWCIEACPTRVQPAVILEAAQRDDLDLAERAGIEACIECGICSYVCPSKLPLLEGIRGMKMKHGI